MGGGMIPTPTGYQNPEFGIAFLAVIVILAIVASLFPKKDDRE
jgi:hypothetical protein